MKFKKEQIAEVLKRLCNECGEDFNDCNDFIELNCVEDFDSINDLEHQLKVDLGIINPFGEENKIK